MGILKASTIWSKRTGVILVFIFSFLIIDATCNDLLHAYTSSAQDISLHELSSPAQQDHNHPQLTGCCQEPCFLKKDIDNLLSSRYQAAPVIMTSVIPMEIPLFLIPVDSSEKLVIPKKFLPFFSNKPPPHLTTGLLAS